MAVTLIEAVGATEATAVIMGTAAIEMKLKLQKMILNRPLIGIVAAYLPTIGTAGSDTSILTSSSALSGDEAWVNVSVE